MPALVAVDLDQNVTGIKHARRLDTLVAPHFDNRLSRHKDFRDFILEIGIPDARLQTVAHLLLVTRVRM
jgi:hypothetical protein